MDKTLILKEIKKAYGFKSDADFARFLGISPQTLSSWYRRNIYDVDILATKCVEVNPEYILTGKGQIMRMRWKCGGAPRCHPAADLPKVTAI